MCVGRGAVSRCATRRESPASSVASAPNYVDRATGRRTGDREGYQTLREIGALDGERRLTGIGRKLARLPIDPRLGRMLMQAVSRTRSLRGQMIQTEIRCQILLAMASRVFP